MNPFILQKLSHPTYIILQTQAQGHERCHNALNGIPKEKKMIIAALEQALFFQST